MDEINAHMEELAQFDTQVRNKVEMYSLGSLDLNIFRTWMLRQDWPPFDPDSLTCRLAAVSWWYTDIIVNGRESEDSYRKKLDNAVAHLIHGFEPPTGSWRIPLSAENLRSSYARLVAGSNQGRGAGTR